MTISPARAPWIATLRASAIPAHSGSRKYTLMASIDLPPEPKRTARTWPPSPSSRRTSLCDAFSRERVAAPHLAAPCS
eukprot:4187672-Alexandrium_andersonii.AAC.1